MDARFWLFGRELHNSFTFGHFDAYRYHNSRQTYLWNTKKELWIQGPPLLGFENQDYSYQDYSSLCAIALNRSTALLLGGNIKVETNKQGAEAF